ncbi:MAG: DUF3332 family protein [Flavobacteriales bacterium]
MKKRIFSAALVPFMLFVGVMQTGCFGEYPLVRKVYTWNSEVGDKGSLSGRFINQLVFIGLNIIPVYGIALTIDGILNLVEFWTGSNPLAMQEGEMEQQVVFNDGKEYLITATKNQFKFEEIKNGVAVNEAYVQYCEEDMSWSAIKDGESYFLASLNSIEGKRATFNIATAEGMRLVTVDGARI